MSVVRMVTLIAVMVATFTAGTLWEASRARTVATKPVATIISGQAKNFGRPITVEGRVAFDGEAPIFISPALSSSYWLTEDPPTLMSKLRDGLRVGHLSCVAVRGTAIVSGNLVSRHAFINHRGIKFERLAIGGADPKCVLSPQENQLLATEL